jgi:beta-glucosidase
MKFSAAGSVLIRQPPCWPPGKVARRAGHSYRREIDEGESMSAPSPLSRPRTRSPGQLRLSMGLDSTDLATLQRLKASGVRVVVVLVSGRPLDIAAQLPDWSALIASWLPGSEGAGVADVLFGGYHPTGKLPVTWPAGAGQEPINSGDGQTGLFPFGYGLSY